MFKALGLNFEGFYGRLWFGIGALGSMGGGTEGPGFGVRAPTVT